MAAILLLLVLNTLDFGNALLVAFPAYLIRRLQAVQNASARLIHRLRRFDHISDALVSLHWLRVPERIEYKISVQVYTDWRHVTLDRSPASLICQIVALFVPRARTDFTLNLSGCPRSAHEPSGLPDLGPATEKHLEQSN